MKFIRKNGRIIPIREKGEKQIKRAGTLSVSSGGQKTTYRGYTQDTTAGGRAKEGFKVGAKFGSVIGAGLGFAAGASMSGNLTSHLGKRLAITAASTAGNALSTGLTSGVLLGAANAAFGARQKRFISATTTNKKRR